jgi:hypothetical protein
MFHLIANSINDVAAFFYVGIFHAGAHFAPLQSHPAFAGSA